LFNCFCSVGIYQSILLVYPCLFAFSPSFFRCSRSSSATSTTEPNIPSSEISALQDFYNAAGGILWNWHYTGQIWDFSGNPNPCSEDWQGILCSSQIEGSTHIHVKALYLKSFDMFGYIPNSVALLKNLTTLNFYDNALYGTIPSSLATLQYLEYLDLSENSLTGSIPANIGTLMTSLAQLRLYNNYLTGIIPDSITQFEDLIVLFLERMSLVMGGVWVEKG